MFNLTDKEVGNKVKIKKGVLSDNFSKHYGFEDSEKQHKIVRIQPVLGGTTRRIYSVFSNKQGCSIDFEEHELEFEEKTTKKETFWDKARKATLDQLSLLKEVAKSKAPKMEPKWFFNRPIEPKWFLPSLGVWEEVSEKELRDFCNSLAIHSDERGVASEVMSQMWKEIDFLRLQLRKR